MSKPLEEDELRREGLKGWFAEAGGCSYFACWVCIE